MSIAVPQASSTPTPAWSIRDGLEMRKMQRESVWETDLKKNTEKVAKIIATSISTEIIKLLEETFNDAFLKIPEEATLLNLNYEFDITKPLNVKKLVQLSGNTELAPFKEWFARLQADFVSEEATSSSTQINSKNHGEIDVDYFRDRMADVGKFAVMQLKKNLAEFQSIPINSALQFSANWLGVEDGFVTSTRVDRITISLWIDPESEIETETASTPIASDKSENNESKPLIGWGWLTKGL